MASLRQIRSSLRSIQNTKQIMRAMQLVSASKLKRSQGRLLQARMVLEFLDGLIARVLASTQGLDHPLCAAREAGLPAAPKGNKPRAAQAGESALVIFTSDTGLCGSYNTNLIQLAESHLHRDSARATQIIYIGKKGYRYFTKRGYAAAEAHLDLAGRPDPKKSEAIGRSLIERFLSGKVSSVDLLYSRFISSMTYKPTVTRWLPIQPQTLTEGKTAAPEEYIFEPSPGRVFEELLPRWTLAKFQLLMLEAFASEHSARMIAMKNATDNAETLIGELTTQRNKIRQASITKEISEIVGTAEALK